MSNCYIMTKLINWEQTPFQTQFVSDHDAGMVNWKVKTHICWASLYFSGTSKLCWVGWMEFLGEKKKYVAWKGNFWLLLSLVGDDLVNDMFSNFFFHWPTVWTICPSRDLDSWLTKHELLKNGLRLCYFTISTLNGEFSNTEKNWFWW